MEENDLQCRICLSNDKPGELIAPCICRGSQQLVHRACLDLWRATNERAFTHCSVCNFEFVIEPVDENSEEAKAAERNRVFKFRMYVARDTALVFLVVQLAIVVLGFVVRALDQDGIVRDLFPTVGMCAAYIFLLRFTTVSDHEKTTYYICGFVVFFAILGLVGIVSACCSGGPPPNDPCGGCYGCYCGDCSGCKGGSDDAGACIIILIVVIVILAFVGIFVGIFLSTMLFQRILQRHMRVLWMKQETKKFVVKDFFGKSVPEEARAAASAPAFVHVHMAEPPSDRDNLIAKPTYAQGYQVV